MAVSNSLPPAITKHLERQVLRTASELADLHDIKFQDIVDYLAALGEQLTLGQNRHVQAAYKLSCRTSGLTDGMLRRIYEALGTMFSPQAVRQTARGLDAAYLDGWVTEQLTASGQVAVRAFGARSVHIIAGNVPNVAATSIIHNAIPRGDMIIKVSSNNPLTALAIALTAIDMAPDHPNTKHIPAAYWKGGDPRVEESIYQPDAIEKIIAWGGNILSRHIIMYIQPGIDLITLDPKLSVDVGARNQEACHSARVVFTETSRDPTGLQVANQFGEMLLNLVRALP